MLQPLSSSENPKLKHLRKLILNSAARRESGQCVVESPLFIKDLLSKQPELIDHIICTETVTDLPPTVTCYSAPEALLKPLASGVFQGLFAIVNRPKLEINWKKKPLTLLYLDRLQNPSNVGAVIRNAAAYDVDAIVMSKGTADPFHPDSIKASAGNCFTIPLYNDHDLTLPRDIHWYALSLETKTPLTATEFPPRCGFIFGTEGTGISNNVVENLQATPLRIEQSDRVDSLNVAVSSGIVLHHRYHKLTLG